LLAFLGGFARYPALAVVLAAAVVASAAAHIRIGRLLLMGEVHRSWRDSTYLKPFGGVLPDATSADLVALAPLAAIAAVLGLWPSPILAPMGVSARDSSALVDLERADARTQRLE
jgi:NADH-quinone oxidoreductase subunit M